MLFLLNNIKHFEVVTMYWNDCLMWSLIKNSKNITEMKCNTSYRCNRKKSWIGCQIIIGREAKNRLDISDGSNNVRSSMFEFLKAKIGVRTWLLSDEHVQCPFDVWSTVRRIFSEHHIALKYADPSKNSIFLQFWKPCSMKIILLRVPYDTW